MLSSNMLVLNLILLIDVTFSTPTDVGAQNPRPGIGECYGDLSTADPSWRSQLPRLHWLALPAVL